MGADTETRQFGLGYDHKIMMEVEVYLRRKPMK